jgi:hypothetical protein
MIAAHPYYCRTVMLVIMPDPMVLDFQGEMVYSTSILTKIAIQSVAGR